jgi:hypothetical protein
LIARPSGILGAQVLGRSISNLDVVLSPLVGSGDGFIWRALILWSNKATRSRGRGVPLWYATDVVPNEGARVLVVRYHGLRRKWESAGHVIMFV